MDAQPERIGKYLVRGELGRGGMGVVYRVFDPDLEREVALKLISAKAAASPVAVSRFLGEARALARIGTPHVVAVHEVVPSHAPPFIVMELIEGRSLARVLRESGPLKPARIADCAAQVLMGLAAAHRAGVLHRDLKPGNLLQGEHGLIKLADFGLARLMAEGANEDLTGDGEVVGTVRYLAPEAARGEEHTPASDLYGLGITLVELASGAHPHAGLRGLDAVQRIAHVPLPPAAALAPGLPRTLAAWLDRLIAHDPAARFASAGAALKALDRAAGDEATASTAPSLPVIEVPSATGPASISTPSQGTVSVVTATVRPTLSDSAPTVPAAFRRVMPFGMRLTIALWLISSLAAAGVGLLSARHAVALQLVHWREELTAAAGTAALTVDGDALARNDHDRVFAQLRQIKQANPHVVDVYCLVRDAETVRNGSLAFAVDGSDELDGDGNGRIDPDEQRAAPGTRYDTRLAPRMLDGFTAACADDEPTRDAWGVSLSGYAPVRTSAGTVAGIIGLDVREHQLAELRRGIWIHLAWLEAGILLAFLAAAWAIARRLSRPVERLVAGMDAAARGDLDVHIAIGDDGEFGRLARAFNRMAGELRDHARLHGAFERFLARGVGAQDEVAAAAELHIDPGPHAPHALVGAALRTARAFAGVPDRVVGRGLVLEFAALSPEDRPDERALRTALALAQSLGPGLAMGVALRDHDDRGAAERRAADLAATGRALGHDLLAEAACAGAVARHFYADRLRLDAGTAQARDVYAIKGAVG